MSGRREVAARSGRSIIGVVGGVVVGGSQASERGTGSSVGLSAQLTRPQVRFSASSGRQANATTDRPWMVNIASSNARESTRSIQFDAFITGGTRVD